MNNYSSVGSMSALTGLAVCVSPFGFWLSPAYIVITTSSYSGDVKSIGDSDNRPEFTARTIRGWLNRLGVKMLFIELGSPWESGYIESFSGKIRNELLNREVFYTLTEAKILIKQWRKGYNQVRPHRSLSYRPPAPEAIMSVPIT